MKVIVSERQRLHHPRHFLVAGQVRESPEVPARVDLLLAGVERLDLAVTAPPDLGLEPASAVHSPDYLHFLATIYGRWREFDGTANEVVPNIHPRRRRDGYPTSPIGQAGWHQADTACPIGRDTWTSALASSHTAAHAADLVLAGDGPVYALCRPPGHHAFADQAGGFCFLNNAAIAAARLRRRYARVAILDLDVHHGNGTQAIFYARGDVMTVSIHADPAVFYPFFWGYAGERGEDAGCGSNLNLPLPLGAGDQDVAAALAQALQRLESFLPEALVVSLGLDAHHDDPFAALKVTTPGFAGLGRTIAGLGLPTVVVQEGGYPGPQLSDALAAFLGPFVR